MGEKWLFTLLSRYCTNTYWMTQQVVSKIYSFLVSLFHQRSLRHNRFRVRKLLWHRMRWKVSKLAKIENHRSQQISIRGRMKPDKLEEMILKHKAEGRKPFFVNCTAGTTVMGAFDPLHQIADVCQKHHLWMHVDVRYNNFPFATKSHRRWLTFISESLSFQVPLTKQYIIHECFWKKGLLTKKTF